MAISVTVNFRPSSSPPSSGRPCRYTGQSVRSLPIRILWVGKKRSRGVQLVFNEYIEKLKLYCTVNDVQIRSNPKNARDWKVQVEDEDNAVMNLIRSNDWVVLLDERGQDIGSEQMANLLGDAGNTGAAGLSFCIGGPYGHGRKLQVMDHSERTKIPSLVFLLCKHNLQVRGETAAFNYRLMLRQVPSGSKEHLYLFGTGFQPSLSSFDRLKRFLFYSYMSKKSHIDGRHINLKRSRF